MKKIYAFLNSPKDLSEIIEFDRDGNKVRSVKYTASYNKRTRLYKWIDQISNYNYDSQGKLKEIIDSSSCFTNYYYDTTGKRTESGTSCDIDHSFFYYDTSGHLIKSEYYRGNFKTPSRQTFYDLNPLKETDIWYGDSIIIIKATTEYERDFYATKYFGYSVEPKLKNDTVVYNGKQEEYGYSDYSDMVRHEFSTTIQNTYNLKGQLIKCYSKQVFMNDRLFEERLTYEYYPNGLLKSIRGYVPEYFRYEFYE